MKEIISQATIFCDEDIVYIRQRARFIASLLGFYGAHQTKISAAISEVVRYVLQYSLKGEVIFSLDNKGASQIFSIKVAVKGLGRDVDAALSSEGTLDHKLSNSLREVLKLMDSYQLERSPNKGMSIFLCMNIPKKAPLITPKQLETIKKALEETPKESSVEEIRLQNRELLEALEELQKKQQQLLDLNQELEDTNRGVKALYEELEEKAQQMHSANQLKTKILSTISHEIRVPINSILSISRILLERLDGELTKEQERQVSFIRESALSLSTLVTDLLEMGSLEKGKTKEHLREFTVEELFSSLRGMLLPVLKKKELPLIFEDAKHIPLLFTDDSKISQILRNFIANAYQFTDEGEVRVRAELSKDGEMVIFSVSDTGKGIPQNEQESIFEEYQQLELDSFTHTEGMGLGLSIARILAQRLGGEVEVKSKINVGSTFYARIPLYYKKRESNDGQSRRNS